MAEEPAQAQPPAGLCSEAPHGCDAGGTGCNASSDASARTHDTATPLASRSAHFLAGGPPMTDAITLRQTTSTGSPLPTFLPDFIFQEEDTSHYAVDGKFRVSWVKSVGGDDVTLSLC